MKTFSRFLNLFLLLLLSSNIIFSQTFVEEAKDGFIIKKLVSNTSINSGTSFSYTIFFSIPAGSSSIVITDNVPANLVIDAVIASPVCGTPTVTTVGNTVTYSLASVATACSGTFQINVHFPPGVTCDGDMAENQICIEAQGLEKLCTERLRVTAKAENPFVTYKQVIAGVNPDASSGCGHIAVVDDTINYKICVLKKSPYYGNNIGQQNLDNAVITDDLPAGAILVSSTCGATQTGTTVTWNVGNLNAATPYVYTCCNFQIYYPSGTFPVGTMLDNQADLSGNACGSTVDTFSNTTCVLLQEPLDSATFAKSVYLSNNVPGCNGFYRITTCNKGNVDLDFDIADVIPSGVTVTQINAFFGAGVTGSYDFTANSGAITLASGATVGTSYTVPLGTTISDINFDYDNLDPGQCAYINIYFTIDPGTSGTITNCANLSSPQIGNLNACVDFDIGNTAPKLCLQKEVCNAEISYSAGDIVRYRLRVQNIGSQTLTGANLQDLLDPNLSYVGNETYYIGSSYATPCAPDPATIPTGTTAWAGISTTHTGSNLTWNLPDIDSDCQAFYHGYCGAYGINSLPFYFIEFDVMVNDDAAAGVVPNNFSGQGGNLPIATTSNTATIVVNAIYGMELNKLISTDGGATFADTALTSAGSNVIYRLAFKNTSNLAVDNIKIIDLLPRDDGANDWLVLNRAVPRGSMFDVTYTGSATFGSTQGPVSPLASIGFTSGNNICLPVLGYSPGGCTSPAAWPWPASPITRNVGFDFTSFSLNQNETLYTDFQVQVPADATVGQKACNDFGANSVGNFILDGSITSVPLTANASAPVCLTVDENQETCCDKVKVETVKEDQCCIKITSECRVNSFTVDVAGGTMASGSWNCMDALGTSFIGQDNFTFGFASPCALEMEICFTNVGSGPITVDLQFDFPGEEECEKSITLDGCKDCCPQFVAEKDTTKCNMHFVQQQSECSVDFKKIDINLSNGTFAGNVTTNCGSPVYVPASYIGTSDVSLNSLCASPSLTDIGLEELEAIDCTKPIIVTMTMLLGDGTICEVIDSILCPCPPVNEDCCPLVEAEYSTCEPHSNLIHGTYTITNVGTNPICYVEITPSPSGFFAQGGLSIDGSPSGIGWTPNRIPTSGNLSPAATDEIVFTLFGNYTGSVNIIVYYCDGSSCDYDMPWNEEEIDDPIVVIGTELEYEKLIATSFVLQAEGNMERAVKYVSVGISEENTTAEFFAISGAVHPADSLADYLARVAKSKMGTHNAFFVLEEALQLKSRDQSKKFNLVFTNELPKLRYTLFDEDGNVIGQADVNNLTSNELTTSIVEINDADKGHLNNIVLAPNPANSQTTLKYDLGKASDLEIEIRDINGQFIQHIFSGRKQVGQHEVILKTNELSAGTYLIRFISEGEAETLQLLIVR